MEIKRIQCPNCGIVLDVRNSKMEDEKLITCPQCKAVLKVRFRHEAPLEAKTVLAGGYNSGETQLGGMNSATQLASAANTKSCYLSVDGRSYPLAVGLNTVGRKAPSSQASLQIETDDLYMSRRHAKIEVKEVSDIRQSIISNDQNKNATYVDGQELQSGDAVILRNGSEIIMGKTHVIYKER